MEDDLNPIPSGTRGMALGIDDVASIIVNWDNGRSLSSIYGVNCYRVLTNQEIN